MISSRRSTAVCIGRCSYTRWLTANVGSMASVRRVTIPNAPRPTVTASINSGSSSREMLTRSPDAVASSMACTAVARLPLATPLPWVAVAHAPATEMCGNDARLARAHPSSCSRIASSPYLIPPSTVTLRACWSSSTTRGSAASETRSPSVSAIVLNECRLPTTRSFVLAAAMDRTSATEAGS